LKATEVAPVKPVPPRVTAVPTVPLVGEKEVTCGAQAVWDTVNGVELVPVPAEVVTLIGPVEAPAGTVALMDESDTTPKDADMPLKRTTFAPVNAFPTIVTAVPGGPVAGKNELTWGAVAACVTEKAVGLEAVPQLVVTLTGPVEAPPGTTALICVSETTATLAELVPLKRTDLTWLNPDPEILTTVPTGPEAGERELTTTGVLLSAGSAIRT